MIVVESRTRCIWIPLHSCDDILTDFRRCIGFEEEGMENFIKYCEENNISYEEIELLVVPDVAILKIDTDCSSSTVNFLDEE